ncbi:MAG: TlpA family protein disulfide reductase [Fuerstiella sp.]|nr:TlpA family protein disulfide reductase [Fuerstiella sp.]
MSASSRPHFLIHPVGLIAFSVLITGCADPGPAKEPNPVSAEDVTPETDSSSSESDSSPPQSATADSSSPQSAGDVQPISLEPGTWDDVQAHIQKSAGKVVVVDLWSTTCLPCLEELPQLGRLQRDKPNDVVCISLSLDYAGIKSKPPTFYEDRVKQALATCNVDVLNYLCTTESDELYAALDLPSIPAVYVYGSDGTLAKRFDASMMQDSATNEEPFTYESDIIPLVEKLISDGR